MQSIEKLLKEIKLRPAMYLGRNSISLLAAFINGWCSRDLENVYDYYLIKDFQKWIEKKYKIRSNHSWSSIILFYSSDENDALNNFFILFEEFLKKESKKIKKNNK
jgi:hypothetical protein